MDALLLLYPPLLLSSFSLLLYGVVRISYSIWWKPKWLERQLKQQGIRGTPYKLLVGDITELVKQMKAAWSKPINLNHQIVPRVDPFTLNNVQKYGKISMFWVGKTPRLIIKDPEMMKEVLSNKQGHFGKPPLNTLILVLTRGLTTLEGETWTKRRRILNPAFHIQKLKGMVPEFSISCNLMIEQWKKMTSDNETGELDIWPELQKLTADVILRAAFGSSYEEGKKMYGLQKKLITLVLESMQSIHIPGFRFLPTKKNRKRKKLVKEITSIMKDLIQKKQNAIRSRQSKVDDILSLLLQCTEENSMTQNTNGTKSAEITIEEVIEECKQFYLAGQETTASLIAWTMIVLCMHPDWQQRAREEVLQVCGKKDPDFEAISHLKTVTMILYEVLRLYPPAIAIYMHTYKETKIGDISIPAGVDLTLPTLLIHHDPELWGDDAGEFKPERFSEGVANASKDQLSFFPFGWGPRTCIGLNFAMIEAKMTLAMILQHFSFELSPYYTHAPHTVMTLQPQHGAQIMLHQL
ncbi:cytochrome P450 72A15-like [Tripterygium wilfordii]|uniref:Cytochrome P450 72A15-like n=1 Tax=Tripterygium wilfordii TaxID=458696 RepID=A0A7J7BW42_TRIWF|nr:cytochrome P450 CYP72A219-like [Tripterygium wilfordii]KAF5726093.1 cytochrome P450 72A15-like [Tripterygium wilfordii]